jgi:hypothetical protein
MGYFTPIFESAFWHLSKVALCLFYNQALVEFAIFFDHLM